MFAFKCSTVKICMNRDHREGEAGGKKSTFKLDGITLRQLACFLKRLLAAECKTERVVTMVEVEYYEQPSLLPWESFMECFLTVIMK